MHDPQREFAFVDYEQLQDVHADAAPDMTMDEVLEAALLDLMQVVLVEGESEDLVDRVLEKIVRDRFDRRMRSQFGSL